MIYLLYPHSMDWNRFIYCANIYGTELILNRIKQINIKSVEVYRYIDSFIYIANICYNRKYFSITFHVIFSVVAK